MGNIFEKIIQLNIRNVRSKDMILYTKLKYQQAMTMMEVKEEDMVKVRDKTTGKMKAVTIDHYYNLNQANMNAVFIAKSRAADLFLLMNNKDENQSILDKTNYRDVITYNKSKEKIMSLYSKLKIVVNFRAIKGVMMLKALITKVKVAK